MTFCFGIALLLQLPRDSSFSSSGRIPHLTGFQLRWRHSLDVAEGRLRNLLAFVLVQLPINLRSLEARGCILVPYTSHNQSLQTLQQVSVG